MTGRSSLTWRPQPADLNSTIRHITMNPQIKEMAVSIELYRKIIMSMQAIQRISQTSSYPLEHIRIMGCMITIKDPP